MSFNNSQIQAIRHHKGPAMVLAGPGSGKTLVITQRTKNLIESYGVNPCEILVITFTKAAASQMQERFYHLMGNGRPAVTFGTFHAIYFKILKYAYGLNPQSILPEEKKQQWLRELIEKQRLDMEEEGEFISGIVSEISLVKGERLDLEHYYAKNCSEDIFKRIYLEYNERLRKNHYIDFDDMLVMTYELLAARPDILAGWQKKYRYILIDEFQDINKVQYDVIRMLAKPENNLFIVGDDDQSIYRFRGAKPEIMLNFKTDYPEAVQILLDVNYRSGSHIVMGALKVIGHNQKRFAKKIQANKPEGYAIDLKEFLNPSEENKTLIHQIQTYIEQGYEYRDMAVLYRINTDPRLLVGCLMEYNIPFRMKESMPNIYEHWIAKNLVSYMKIAMGSKERGEFLQIINRPKRYISRDCFDSPEVSLEALERYYEDKDWMLDRIRKLEYDIRFLRDLTPYAAITYIRRGIGYEDYLKEYAQYRRLQADDLYKVLDELQESSEGYHTYEDWFAHMEAYKEELNRKKQEIQMEENQVELATLHSSKGLEYEIVFIIDAGEGVMPHHKAVLEEDIEEERRMFYVGMTRAKERLHIYYTKERYHKPVVPSRFVEELREGWEAK